MKCSICKHELRAGGSKTETKHGKTYRVINMICPTKGCQNYKKTIAVKEVEVSGT